MKRFLKPVTNILIAAMFVSPAVLYAGPLPSKIDREQSLKARQGDLIRASLAFQTDSIAEALRAEGLTEPQIDARIAALSTEDIRTLTTHPAQIRSAGLSLSKRTWTIIGIAAAAIAVGVVALDDDDTDAEGEED